jgi:hypothetical protein
MKQYFQFNDEFYNGFINLLIDYYNRFIANCKNDNLVPIPIQVSESTKLYFDDHDSLLSVINENFDITNDAKDRLVRKDLYQHYCNSEGQFKVGKTDFFNYLRTSLELEETKVNGTMYFKGIKTVKQLDLIDYEL